MHLPDRVPTLRRPSYFAGTDRMPHDPLSLTIFVTGGVFLIGAPIAVIGRAVELIRERQKRLDAGPVSDSRPMAHV